MRYTFGDWELDLQLYELRRAGSPVKLEPQVFNVLAYLLQHRDRVVSRQELLEQLWVDQFIGDSAIERCIMAARKAAGDNGSTQRVIKTLHGRGYRFVAPVQERTPSPADVAVSIVPLPRPAAQQAPRSSADETPHASCPVLDGERKPVTVLCCALANATALSRHLEPETLYGLIQRFCACALEEVERYGGTLQHVGETALLALFGAPVAYEDHARRAVLAALRLQQRLREGAAKLETLPGTALTVRIGVHTGLVMVGRFGAAEQLTYVAIGDTTRLARYLQDVAAPGAIFLSESVRRLVQDAVDVTVVPASSCPAGTHPTPVYTVRGLVSPCPQPRRAPACLQSRFVGREHELDLIRALWARARSGQGQVVGLVGEAGMGKSRLLAACRRHLEETPVTYLEGQCVSYGDTVPYLPLRTMLWHVCGLTEADNAKTIRAKVTRRLQEVGLGPEEDAPYVLRLLVASEGASALAALNPEAVRARTFAILRQLCLEGSRQQPCIMVVENLHWIDAASEAYLASLVARLATAPLFLLTTYRPGYRPPWLATSYATQISLQPLTADASLQVMRSVLQKSHLPPALMQAIVAQAGGNPFFVEELTRTALEHPDEAPTWRLPDTVQAVVMARIDQLSAAAKQLLQAAAVIGSEVPLSLLQAIAELPEAQLHPSLTCLQEAEFLHEARLVPDRVYTFKQAVIREVVYSSLVPARRQALQARLATVSTADDKSRLVNPEMQCVYHLPLHNGTRHAAQL